MNGGIFRGAYMRPHFSNSKLFASLFICAIALAFAACGKKNNFKGNGGAEEPVMEEPPTLDAYEGNFSDFEPALVTKRPSCIACHARVTGNWISSFEGPSSPFEASNEDVFRRPAGLRLNAWSEIALQGEFVVPKKEITSSVARNALPAGVPFTVKSLLTSNLMLPVTLAKDFVSPSVTQQTPIPPLLTAIGAHAPNTKGVTAIKEADISIDPPQPKEIEALTESDAMEQIAKKSDVILALLKDKAKLQGLDVVDGQGKPFVKNSSAAVECEGDVVVKGDLFLSNVTIDSGSEGCRIYVSGVIAIQGNVSVKSSRASNKANLQLAAGIAIHMGVKRRFLDQHMTDLEVGNTDHISGFGDDAGPFAAVTAPGGSEMIAYSDSWDGMRTSQSITMMPGKTLANPNCAASNVPVVAGNNCQAHWIGSVTSPAYGRKSFDYDHILFAAPYVSSRYYGRIRGSVVADFPLFALEHLVFEYDSVFSEVNVLPLLNRPLYTAK